MIEQEARLEPLLFEAIASGIIALDADRRIVAFNRAAGTTFGIYEDDVLGRDAAALDHYLPDLGEMLETFFASGAAELRAEVNGWRAPDQELTLELRMTPLALVAGHGVAVVVNDRTVQRALEEAHSAQIQRANMIEAAFSRYLAPHVVRALIANPGAVSLGGVRQRATTLFADIRGFTGLAAQLPADHVVDLLNRYFEEAVRVVFAHEGLLDKFYGDGLLAVFGPPLVRDDDARRAVQAALQLINAVDRLNEHLDTPLAISIGLGTGDVVAGHVGSARRMDYTVIGDAVNLAAGLQQAAAPGTVCCDEATYRAAELALDAEPLAVQVKGRSDPVVAYRLVTPHTG